MAKNLLIVESPAKATTIEKYLGKDYTVKSSFGHIRDLVKKGMGIDIHNNFKPMYQVDPEKVKLVSELKQLANKAETIWLASDEDREGEAIAWHLAEVLELDPRNTKRIVFNEITKDAILKAIQNPRSIDTDLVNAQQARRVLDRIVGFEISPVLWKKIRGSLSAGRVQSVAVRIIVDREREIRAFKAASSFKLVADFHLSTGETIAAELNQRLADEQEATDILNLSKNATYSIQSVEQKPGKKAPAPPFTTSTLQQEAGRKLGMSVSRTMAVAQRLYESGFITYMRTDSVNLSDYAMNMLKTTILSEYGSKYYKARHFQTKTKGAQEAHEAIRPTDASKASVSRDRDEERLYKLIRNRTLASQMADAEVEKTTITIASSNLTKHHFIASGEVITFDGFLRLYAESHDDETSENTNGKLPQVKANDELIADKLTASEVYTKHPPRYTEPSLVKKLEELGIGRPSTYAPTISTIQKREYITKEDRPAEERSIKVLTLISNKLSVCTKKEKTGAEKAKLFPTDTGTVVTDFLVDHFPEIIDYGFTAKVEEQFDHIAEGKLQWTSMLDKFYQPFHSNVTKTEESSERSRGERVIGTTPDGKTVSARIGRYGPLVQIGDASENEKPQFASLLKGQTIETITLEEALELFKLPRTIGEYEAMPVVAAIGRFGPYLQHNKKFYALKGTNYEPLTISLEEAIAYIELKRSEEVSRHIAQFEHPDSHTPIEILNGIYGPYISYDSANYKIPKGTDPLSLNLDACLEIINAGPTKKSASKTTKRSSTTKTKSKTK